MTIKVLIADDQALVRTGFRLILETDPDMAVVGEADNGHAAIEAVGHTRPDVVLMDIRMPHIDGLEATRRIMAADHHPRVLILTTFDSDEYVFDALVAGASGFILKDVSAEDLLAAIRVIATGESLVSPAITRRLIESFVREHATKPHDPPGMSDLTPRELEIFKLVARGLSNAEIADKLVLSHPTVKTHIARALMKLSLRDRVQAVVLAYESGIVQPGSHP